MIAGKARKGLSWSLLVLWSMSRVRWGTYPPAAMAPIFIAAILKDFWVHSLILPFPSTEKQWLSPLCVTPGAGCHVEKADTPSLGSLQRCS